VLEDESAPVDWLPLVAFDPVQAPLAAQLVALVVDQVSVEDPPLDTEAGLALKVTMGAGLAVTVTVTDLEVVPPAPVQAKV